MITTALTLGLYLSNCAMLSVPTQVAAESPRTSLPDLENTVKDVEALRLLLTQEIQSCFDRARHSPAARGDKSADPDDPKAAESAIDPTTRWLRDLNVVGRRSPRLELRPGAATPFDLFFNGANQSATSFTRGFYAPGVGVWIDTTVSIPVTYDSTRETLAATDAANEEDAAWNRALQEASNQPNPSARSAAPGKSLRTDFDSQRVEEVISVAKSVLLRFAKRVRNLTDDESVVIALRLEGDSKSPFYGRYAITSEDALQFDAEGNVSTTPGSAATGEATIVPPLSRTVILRVKLSHLAAHAAGEFDDAALEKRIQVTQY